MFGFTKKKISVEQVVGPLIDFSTNENVVDEYKELLNVNKMTSSQKREIYIFNMHATVNAVQSSLDSKELTKKLLNLYHLTVYQMVSPDIKSQKFFEELVIKRYGKYYAFTNSIEDETSMLHLGEEFLNNFFGNKDDGELVMTVTISSMYVIQLTTTKGLLDEIQTKFIIT